VAVRGAIAFKMNPPAITLPDEKQQAFSALKWPSEGPLVRRRQWPLEAARPVLGAGPLLVDMRVAEKNRIQQSHPDVRGDKVAVLGAIQRHLDWLTTEIDGP